MRLILLTMLLFGCGAAQAQPAAPPGPADTGKLLQDLVRKIDRLQGDVDRLKKAPKPTTADPDAAAPTRSPTQAAPAAQERKGGGWAVGVYSQAIDKRPPERVGRFIAQPGGFTFGDLRRTIAHPGWASFIAEGTYVPRTVGNHRYVYSVRIVWDKVSTVYTARCMTKITVNGQEIIDFSFQETTARNSDRSMSGGIELEQDADPQGLKTYPVKAEFGCSLINYERNISDDAFIENPATKGWFDGIKVIFGVTGPDDMAGRPPTVQELIHDIDRKK